MARFTTNYNLEKPEDNDWAENDVLNANFDKIDTAIAAAGNNPELEADVAEIKVTVNRIDTGVGRTNDPQGTANAGTVMGKLNKLIQDVATHVGSWTSARAMKLDTLDAGVGKTTDTGGTATSGTVMGKLNKLIQDIATHMGNWTAARAMKLDTLDAGVGKATDTGGTATSGTVMGKSNKALEILEKISTDTGFYSTFGRLKYVEHCTTVSQWTQAGGKIRFQGRKNIYALGVIGSGAIGTVTDFSINIDGVTTLCEPFSVSADVGSNGQYPGCRRSVFAYNLDNTIYRSSVAGKPAPVLTIGALDDNYMEITGQRLTFSCDSFFELKFTMPTGAPNYYLKVYAFYT